MSWTDERVDALKTMWGEGKSASQIAKALGGVTRNAVIGKVHRLGLSNRAAAPKAAAKDAAPAKEEKAEAPARARKPAAEPPAKEAAPEAPAADSKVEPEAAPVEEVQAAAPAVPIRPTPPVPGQPLPPQAVSEVSEEARRNLIEVEKKARKLNLLQLTERTCKWPIGDPATDDFYFCGLPAHGGKPYCEDHVAVAFQPMSSRRDRSRSR